jgi:2-oxoglutarate ferredoxin oxidoreductase subunit delta
MARFRGIVTIDPDRCKGCSLCVDACPFHVLSIGKGINAKGYHPAEVAAPESCTACALCAQMCPDVCIVVAREETA